MGAARVYSEEEMFNRLYDSNECLGMVVADYERRLADARRQNTARRKSKTVTLKFTDDDQLEIMANSQPELGLGDERLLTVPEAACMLGIGPRKVRRLVKAGALVGRKRGPKSHWKIAEGELRRYMSR